MCEATLRLGFCATVRRVDALRRSLGAPPLSPPRRNGRGRALASDDDRPSFVCAFCAQLVLAQLDSVLSPVNKDMVRAGLEAPARRRAAAAVRGASAARRRRDRKAAAGAAGRGTSAILSPPIDFSAKASGSSGVDADTEELLLGARRRRRRRRAFAKQQSGSSGADPPLPRPGRPVSASAAGRTTSSATKYRRSSSARTRRTSLRDALQMAESLAAGLELRVRPRSATKIADWWRSTARRQCAPGLALVVAAALALRAESETTLVRRSLALSALLGPSRRAASAVGPAAPDGWDLSAGRRAAVRCALAVLVAMTGVADAHARNVCAGTLARMADEADVAAALVDAEVLPALNDLLTKPLVSGGGGSGAAVKRLLDLSTRRRAALCLNRVARHDEGGAAAGIVEVLAAGLGAGR